MIRRLFLIFSVFTFFYSCSEEIINVIPEPEEDSDLTIPSTFEITVSNLTDKEVSISWTQSTDTVWDIIKYEVTLNDSVVAYDLTARKYTFNNLLSATNYKIGVNAYDLKRNMHKVNINITTLESLIVGAFKYDLELYVDYRFEKVIKTSDNGFLLVGLKYDSNFTERFLLKLNADLSLNWIKEYSCILGDNIDEVIQLSDNGYLTIRYNTITKYSENGDLVWEKNLAEGARILAGCEKNNDLFLAGIKSTSTIDLETFVIKVDVSGSFVWQKYYGSSLLNIPTKIISKENENLMIYGNASESDFNNENQAWLLEMDTIGNVIFEKKYSDSYNGRYLSKDLFSVNGKTLVCGSIAGIINSSYTNRPRLTLLDGQGDIIWDIYPEINMYSFPTYEGMLSINENEFISYFYGDGGVKIIWFDMSGNALKNIPLYDFACPAYMCFMLNGNIVYFDQTGYIIVINPNGYIND